jgi:hypothetical protein
METCRVSGNQVGCSYCTSGVCVTGDVEREFHCTVVAEIVAATIADVLHLKLFYA